MNGFGFSEMLLVGLLLLLFVGPERMPTVVRQMGRLYGRLRRAADELRRALVLEADRMDEEGRLKDLRKRRLEAEQERQRMAEEHGSRAQDPSGGPPRAAEPPVGDPAGAPADDPASSPDPEVAPAGFTPEEWRELPPHIREIVARRRSTP